MPKVKELQGIVGANVRRLRLEHAPEAHRTIKAFAAWVGLGNGTIDRIEKAATDAQLSSVAMIAARFGLEPWHLLVADASPDNKPRVLAPHEASLYDRFESLMEEVPRHAAEAQQLQPTKRPAHRRRKRK